MKQIFIAVVLMMFASVVNAAGWVPVGGVIVKPDGGSPIVVPIEATGPIFIPFSTKALCDAQREAFLLEKIKQMGSNTDGSYAPYNQWIPKQASKTDVSRCIQVQ